MNAERNPADAWASAAAIAAKVCRRGEVDEWNSVFIGALSVALRIPADACAAERTLRDQTIAAVRGGAA